MKKYTCFLISLCLTVALFAGCSLSNTTPGTTEQTIEQEIIQAFYDTEMEDSIKNRYTTNDLSLRFRGAFSDTYVVFVDGPYLYFTMITSDVVGGIVFTYPDSHKMVAYHQGVFYSLPQAYDQGFLTIDDIMQLRENYIASGSGSMNSLTNKGDVPTTRKPCTHNQTATNEGSQDPFAYTISDAQYLYANIGDTHNFTVFVIQSVDELALFCDKSKTELDKKHNDSFFQKNSLIVINQSVQKSPANFRIRSLTEGDHSTVMIEIDSYTAYPISALPKTNCMVIEANRVLSDGQVKHIIHTSKVSEAEFSKLFPQDPIHPVFQPGGIPMEDSLKKLKEHMEGSDNWYARAAASIYSTPADVNLYELFREAYPQYKDFTDAELAFLNTTFLADYIGNLDIVKIPVKEMNSVLRQYFGITLEQTNKVGTDRMVYFADTDCYYCISNDSDHAPLILHSVYYNAGTYVYYEIGEADGYPEYVMSVKFVNTKPVILSNQRT